MDLDQFRKIYSDFRLAEARAKADQYKAWDYSSQHSSMRAPYDKRQFDPRTDKPEELYYKEPKFVQFEKPKTYLSHLTPTITGGINSRLAGKDFRSTETKFATYGELFNHIPMVPDVINIIKQILTPLQTQIFLESINSIEENEKSPGLILTITVIDFVRSMTSSLLSTRDALENNDRRVYKDSLNKIKVLQGDESYKTLPSKAAELLSRLTDIVLTLNNTKQDLFDSADTEEPDVRAYSSVQAEEGAIQNQINIDNSIRPQTQMEVRPLRAFDPKLEGLNGQDYREGAALLLQLYSDLLDQVTTTEAPMPVLKSQATSSTKSSNVKTINTDVKSKLPEKRESLKELLKKLIKKGEDGKDDEGDDNPPGDTTAPAAPAAPAAQAAFPQPPPPIPPATPPTTTPQGPTTIVPNNATMVPTQPTPAETIPQNITTPITQTPTTQTQTPTVTKDQLEPTTIATDAFGKDFIDSTWKEQSDVLFKMPDKAVSEMFIMTKQYTGESKVTNNLSLFYVNAPARLRLYLLLSKFRDTFPASTTTIVFIRGETGLSKNETDPQLYKAISDAIFGQTSAKASTGPLATTEVIIENKPKKYKRNPTTGRMEGFGKRGRGRPKRVREDEEIETTDKKPRVQPSSSLSSISLPVQVSDTSNVLEKHKDDIVTSITVKRSPIPQFMEDLFESLSNGTWSQLKKKHGFDSFFHLAAVINDTILIEKNSNGINVADYKPYDSEEIQIPSKLLGKFTLGQMIEKVKNEMGSDFYSYHPFENNCQNFMFRFLKDSKALTPQIAEFVSQPIENLVKDLPEYFPPLVKTAADVYGVIQPMLNPNS